MSVSSTALSLVDSFLSRVRQGECESSTPPASESAPRRFDVTFYPGCLMARAFRTLFELSGDGTLHGIHYFDTAGMSSEDVSSVIGWACDLTVTDLATGAVIDHFSHCQVSFAFDYLYYQLGINREIREFMIHCNTGDNDKKKDELRDLYKDQIKYEAHLRSLVSLSVSLLETLGRNLEMKVFDRAVHGLLLNHEQHQHQLPSLFRLLRSMNDTLEKCRRMRRDIEDSMASLKDDHSSSESSLFSLKRPIAMDSLITNIVSGLVGSVLNNIVYSKAVPKGSSSVDWSGVTKLRSSLMADHARRALEIIHESFSQIFEMNANAMKVYSLSHSHWFNQSNSMRWWSEELDILQSMDSSASHIRRKKESSQSDGSSQSTLLSSVSTSPLRSHTGNDSRQYSNNSTVEDHKQPADEQPVSKPMISKDDSKQTPQQSDDENNSSDDESCGPPRQSSMAIKRTQPPSPEATTEAAAASPSAAVKVEKPRQSRPKQDIRQRMAVRRDDPEDSEGSPFEQFDDSNDDNSSDGSIEAPTHPSVAASPPGMFDSRKLTVVEEDIKQDHSKDEPKQEKKPAVQTTYIGGTPESDSDSDCDSDGTHLPPPSSQSKYIKDEHDRVIEVQQQPEKSDPSSVTDSSLGSPPVPSTEAITPGGPDLKKRDSDTGSDDSSDSSSDHDPRRGQNKLDQSLDRTQIPDGQPLPSTMPSDPSAEKIAGDGSKSNYRVGDRDEMVSRLNEEAAAKRERNHPERMGYRSRGGDRGRHVGNRDGGRGRGRGGGPGAGRSFGSGDRTGSGRGRGRRDHSRGRNDRDHSRGRGPSHRGGYYNQSGYMNHQRRGGPSSSPSRYRDHDYTDSRPYESGSFGGRTRRSGDFRKSQASSKGPTTVHFPPGVPIANLKPQPRAKSMALNDCAKALPGYSSTHFLNSQGVSTPPQSQSQRPSYPSYTPPQGNPHEYHGRAAANAEVSAKQQHLTEQDPRQSVSDTMMEQMKSMMEEFELKVEAKIKQHQSPRSSHRSDRHKHGRRKSSESRRRSHKRKGKSHRSSHKSGKHKRHSRKHKDYGFGTSSSDEESEEEAPSYSESRSESVSDGSETRSYSSGSDGRRSSSDSERSLGSPPPPESERGYSHSGRRRRSASVMQSSHHSSKHSRRSEMGMDSKHKKSKKSLEKRSLSKHRSHHHSESPSKSRRLSSVHRTGHSQRSHHHHHSGRVSGGKSDRIVTQSGHRSPKKKKKPRNTMSRPGETDSDEDSQEERSHHRDKDELDSDDEDPAFEMNEDDEHEERDKRDDTEVEDDDDEEVEDVQVLSDDQAASDQGSEMRDESSERLGKSKIRKKKSSKRSADLTKRSSHRSTRFTRRDAKPASKSVAPRRK